MAKKSRTLSERLEKSAKAGTIRTRGKCWAGWRLLTKKKAEECAKIDAMRTAKRRKLMLRFLHAWTGRTAKAQTTQRCLAIYHKAVRKLPLRLHWRTWRKTFAGSSEIHQLEMRAADFNRVKVVKASLICWGAFVLQEKWKRTYNIDTSR